MRRWLALLLVLVGGTPGRAAAADPRECVVLLHGVALSSWTMSPLERALTDAGYRVVNLAYPSRQLPFDELAGAYLPARLREHDVARAPRVHFVTHSLGSLVLRGYLRDHRPANLGRVVMLGPPNQGSTAADHARQSGFLRWVAGRNLGGLGTGDDAIVRRLGPADFEVGIIAGTARANPLFDGILASPNDGAVTVESARLEGMRDFLVVPYSHTAMLWREPVMAQVLAFLRHGRFERSEPAAP